MANNDNDFLDTIKLGLGIVAIIVVGSIVSAIFNIIGGIIRFFCENIGIILGVVAVVALFCVLGFILERIDKSNEKRKSFDKDFGKWIKDSEIEIKQKETWIEQEGKSAQKCEEQIIKLEEEVKRFR